jgi:FtsP/CotA-like multicopper oxidase with cupredoxin domain
VNANGGGQYAKITLTKGKKHRIRLINTAVDQVFHVTADNHPFTVITTDFVPAKPWVTNQLTLQIGKLKQFAFRRCPTK